MAPGLGPLIDGDTPGYGSGDLWVAVVNGGGPDYQITVSQVLRVVADGHRDSQGPQAPDRIALRHVGTLDPEAHTLEDLRQRAHGYAADAH